MTFGEKEPLVLAIDLGTSAAKVALISVFGEIVAVDNEKTRLILLPNGGAEQDPHDWWNAIQRATHRLLACDREAAHRVIAVSCTAQWSGTVAVEDNGRALGNAIIWMDSRGAKYVEKMIGGVVNIRGYGIGKLVRWLRVTGGAPARSGKDSLAHMLFLKHERPCVYERADKFLEPKDYLNALLTGEYAASYDSMALCWLCDNRNLTRVVYDPQLLAMTGIDREKLPRMQPATEVLGLLKREIAEALGLRPDVVVITGAPDVQAAAVGSGAVEDYAGHLYLGTSSWLTCHVPKKKTDVWNNMTTLPSAIPHRYFVANEQECAGACLTFLRNALLPRDGIENPDAFRFFDKLAQTAPAGSGKVIFTPWLYGERTPVEDAAIRGGFHNVSLTTTQEDLVRSVFEGVAYNSRWLLSCVESFIGRRMEALNAIGGGAQSDVWCQIYADVLNRRILQVRDPLYANARGAGFLASVALGYLGFSDIPSRVVINKAFYPRDEFRELYDALFCAFRDLYKHHRKVCAKLNRTKRTAQNCALEID